MKNLLLFAAFFGLFFVVSCDKDDDDEMTDFQYHAHVHSPNTDDKHVGDTIHIHVEFESHSNETVHHVNVRIYKKGDETEEVYNAPGDAHVHAQGGKYEHHDDFVLSNDNGVTEHTDWVLEAKVWGHEAGMQEVVETIEFHVHP